jgi:hypothetical protein
MVRQEILFQERNSRRKKMGLAEDIKKLGEDIVASYDSRVMASNSRAKAIRVLKKDTHEMLKGFNAGHKEMSANQAKALANFVADLTKNVGHMITTFQKEHKDMADALKVSLEKNTKDIETYVKNKLQEFSDAHADMSEELKKDLAEYVADIVKETKERLSAFKDEREKMAANWQAMAATMAKKRGKLIVEAGAEVKTVEEVVEKPKKRKARNEVRFRAKSR